MLFSAAHSHHKRCMSLRHLFIMCRHRRQFITGPWSMVLHIITAITGTVTGDPLWLLRDPVKGTAMVGQGMVQGTGQAGQGIAQGSASVARGAGQATIGVARGAGTVAAKTGRGAWCIVTLGYGC